MKIKVCAIGAGAAGLCAVRHLAEDSNNFEFVVYERQRSIGGTWTYTDKIGIDEDDGLPVHSSMYRDLKTNLPKEIMGFPDFPCIKGGIGSCVSHNVILKYLEEYAAHFGLHRFIEFHTIVESVKLIDSTNEKWEVVVKNLKNQQKNTLVFDSVIICNGHFSVPYIPVIEGIKDFRGQTMHSHDYRKPEDFVGKKVIVLGAASSGVDIAIDISRTATIVYLSHNNDRLAVNNESLSFTEIVGIDRFKDDRFILKNGSSITDVDVIIFCTGYDYTYKFLDTSCGVTIDENYVSPLYKHLVSANHPSMCFVGLTTTVVPFPIFHVQIRYFLRALLDKKRLPALPLMFEDSRLKSPIKRHAHKLGYAQWAYNESLARAGGFESLPGYYELGSVAWTNFRMTHIMNYKSFDLIVAEDGLSVRIVEPGEKSKG